MPSDVLLNLTAGLVSTYGLSSESLLILISIVLATSVAIIVAVQTKHKEISVVVFFFVMALLTLSTVTGWIIFILGLVLVSAMVFYTKTKGG